MASKGISTRGFVGSRTWEPGAVEIGLLLDLGLRRLAIPGLGFRGLGVWEFRGLGFRGLEFWLFRGLGYRA